MYISKNYIVKMEFVQQSSLTFEFKFITICKMILTYLEKYTMAHNESTNYFLY